MSGSPSDARPGAAVAWWNGSELAVGIVVGEEKSRLRILPVRGREERVRPTRLATVIESSGPVPGDGPQSRREAAERAAAVETRVRARAGSVDVAVLWEIVVEAGGPSLAAVDLAALALDDEGGEAATAVMLALLGDGLRFVRRGDVWEPRAPEQVGDIALQREREAARERDREAALAALERVARGEPWRPSGNDVERRYLEALETLAIHDLNAPDAARALAVEALDGAGVRHERPHAAAFRLLRAVGRFDDDDQNLQLLRFRLTPEFPEAVSAAAEAAAARGFDRRGREDRSGREAISIDGAMTREIDDLVSLEPLDAGPPGAVRLGVHIADPAAFIAAGDPVDEEARARGLSHYHPDVKLRMLPPALSERAASLNEGEERPALSFLVDLDGAGEILAWRVARTIVRSSARLDYDEADLAIAAGEGRAAALLHELDGMAALREAARERAGAVLIRTPDVGIHLGADGVPRLERLDGDSASRRIVTEAMVLAGQVAASWCIERGLPAIFRTQPAPSEPVMLPPGGAGDPVAARRVRMTLRRGESSLDPGPHHALGLEAYAQATSPLRRYQDLVVHRQIAASLAGVAPPYDRQALAAIAATTDQAEAEARVAERVTNEYWLLRWLGERVGEELDALVVDTEPRPIVHLVETAWEQPMPSLAGLPTGTTLRVRVERVDPRAGILALRRIDP